jgi:hypothetical protein
MTSTKRAEVIDVSYPDDEGSGSLTPKSTGRARVPADDDNLLQVVKDMPLVEEVRRFLSMHKVKKAVALGTQLFDAATPFLDKPSWWSGGKAAFHMSKVLVEDVEVYNEDFFSGDEWVEPYSSDFNQTLLNVLRKFPYEKIKTSVDDSFIKLLELPNGIKIGWTYTTKSKMVGNIYVETARVAEVKAYIKDLLWEQFLGKNLVMRKNVSLFMKENDSCVIFEEDDTFASKMSKRASSYAEYLKRPIAAGVPRSVMFYGPPGTGKSTMARTIIDLIGLRSFRIRIADLGQLDNATLFEALSIFQPEAVILDDFDRTHHQSTLLDTLEHFQKTVKLVLITVNNRKKLDSALRRPGRIDEIELVDIMDEEVVRAVLGDFQDGYPVVKDWPISFIKEYVVRRSFLSSEEAAMSVQELAQRVKELDGYHDEDDNGLARMVKLLKAAKHDDQSDESPSREAKDTSTADDDIFDELNIEKRVT